jgi:translation initiation factor 2B subunit (eIF-2B alpha/beta/delta family)
VSTIKITFDTLDYMKTLRDAGIQQNEAEAMASAAHKAFSQLIDGHEVATKRDLVHLRSELQSFIVKSISGAIVIIGAIQTLLHFYK